MRTTLALAAVLVLGVSTTAAAQRHGGRHGQGGAASAAQTALAEQLASSDPAQVRAAIEQIGVAGTADGIAPLAARIEHGLPPDLLDAALDALTVLARPEAGPVLMELATHRRAGIRAKAVMALVAAHARGADGALTGALSDLDPAVRSAAAIGLGQLGARGAVDALFLAFEKGVAEAATSLGQLVAEGQIPRLVGYLGQFPFDTVTPALDELFARHDLPEQAKLGLVDRLAELATPQVKTYLETLAQSLPADAVDLRRAAVESAGRINAR